MSTHLNQQVSGPVLVRGGRVINASDAARADVLCHEGRIVRLGENITESECPTGTTVIDASGKNVFPGFIDPHVHIYLPFMGTFAKDTWETGGRAALLGGTTTLIEMICPGKTDDPLAAFELWLSKATGIAPCDFSFHMGVTRFDGDAERAFREIHRRGITSFKVFLAYKGALGVSDSELYQALRLAAELGAVVTAHCENETLVEERQNMLLAQGKTGPEWHEPSRPAAVEAEGVHHLMTFAELTGAEVYIVHTSCDEAVREAQCGMARGVRAWIEVVLPHLVLDQSATRRTGFEGAKFVMSPPLREASQLPRMWSHLAGGAISTVATDHAPFDFESQKSMGKDAFTKIPNGIPSVEHRADLLYTHGVTTGRLDLHQFVAAVSTNAARIFGLKGKGAIAVGADADIVIHDPAYTGRISARTHSMATDYSAFEGWEVKGRAQHVLVRGRVMVHHGRFVGPMGWGQLVRRG